MECCVRQLGREVAVGRGCGGYASKSKKAGLRLDNFADGAFCPKHHQLQPIEDSRTLPFELRIRGKWII